MNGANRKAAKLVDCREGSGQRNGGQGNKNQSGSNALPHSSDLKPGLVGALDEQRGTAEGAGERGQRFDGRRQLRQRIAGELVEVHGDPALPPILLSLSDFENLVRPFGPIIWLSPLY